MRSLINYCVGVLTVAAAVFARGQSIGSYTWTNVLAFPPLSTFSIPICITTPVGETNRLFVCEHSGNIYAITNLAAPTKTLFLNLTSKVLYTGEAGILGMAFHPGFATNGYFFVTYTMQSNSTIYDVLSRYHISSTNANVADATSEVRFIVQSDRANNHNGGDIHFGPDGYLYMGEGDEGNEDNSLGDAQHIDQNLFSGILRIDVDNLPGNLPPNPSPTFATTTNYSIPQDNPFIGTTSFDGNSVDPNQVRTEFWAVGLRNPWRMSFDPVTGLLYAGDVGQDTWEEVDIIKAGANYGWATWEGTNSPPPNVSITTPTAQNVTPPIITYKHGSATNQGNCVIGGVVYRGNRFPQLNGYYVYGDYSTARFWATYYDGTNASTPVSLFVGTAAMAFGVDPRNGDVLYCENGGNIKRIIALKPVITSMSYDDNNNNVIVSGAGGVPNAACMLFISTNLTSWGNVLTGQFDFLGNFTLTNPVDPNAPLMYYRVAR